MTKHEMIKQLKARVLYNEEQRAHYEDLNERDPSPVWSEMIDWYKGKIAAFNISLELAEELERW
jgi:hypothetical protein